MGSYDEPIIHNIPDGWEYRLYTNNQSVKDKYPEAIFVEHEYLSDVLFARHIKIMPWKYFDFDVCIWIDGNTKFDPERIEDLTKYDFVVSSHPLRDCIYREAKSLIQFKKEDPGKLDSIVKRYKRDGFPESFGLHATHALVRWNTPENHAFCRQWWHNVKIFSHRDQMSFDYLRWKYDLKVCSIPFWTIFKTTTVHHNGKSMKVYTYPHK